MTIWAPLLFLGTLAAFFSWRWRRRVCRSLPGLALPMTAILCLIAGGYAFWYYHRPLPEPISRQPLFRGITYAREIQRLPRPLIIHVVSVDLEAPGIRFCVTPEEPCEGHHLPARTTSQFLDEFKVQLAINGSYFYPWYANGPFSYYPHVGDPVNVKGLCMSEGRPYSDYKEGYRGLYFSRDNQATFADKIPARTLNAISGREVLVDKGRALHGRDDEHGPFEPHPRTAVALDASGKRLLLFVVDGRQPNYSEGVTLRELADIIIERGGHDAVNMDGGGSSTLVIEGPDGSPTVLNSPSHGRIPPGRERPVANHLGIFAERE